MLSLRENQWKNIYRRLLYTKYKAENNALWTIYVKYGLKMYREVWDFGILKCKLCRNPVLGRVGSWWCLAELCGVSREGCLSVIYLLYLMSGTHSCSYTHISCCVPTATHRAAYPHPWETERVFNSTSHTKPMNVLCFHACLSLLYFDNSRGSEFYTSYNEFKNQIISVYKYI